jgi:hypothetical protein
VGDEREDIADELRRLRDEARRGAGPEQGADAPPAAAPAPPLPGAVARVALEAGAAEPTLPSPDATAVNAAWRAETGASGGLSGLLRHLLERILGPRFEAQRTFNARQVQLDNEILEYLDRRLASTHRHYDRLLGALGRRLDEADQRHAILERELVGHVRDLVRRIDLVLADGSRGRLAMEFDLEEVRERLARVENALQRSR